MTNEIKAQSSGVVLPELIAKLVNEIERNTCMHESTHRGGVIWEICDDCGAKWSDDRNPRPEFKWPDCVTDAHALLARLNSSPVSAGEYGDAYQGAREDLAIWKRRALEAESKIREQDQIIENMGNALNDENGPTFMGEPVVSAGGVDDRAAFEAWVKTFNSMPAALFVDDRGRYVDDWIQCRWLGWQARAALSASAPSHGEQVREVLSIQVCKLGRYGAAFDPASTHYAYIYADQPDNVGAMKIGRAALSVKPGGDEIDAGLCLLDRLSREGFGVFQIAATPSAGSQKEQGE